MAIGAYSKVVSTTRQIDSIHTFIGGTKKDITSVWVFVNGARKQVFPSTEIYTEIFTKTTSGAYSTTLSYGRYKIVISGAGGGGAACGWNYAHGTRYAENGYAGNVNTVYVDVANGETLDVSGIVGAGGTGGYARTEHKIINHGGYGGTGYQNGANGTNQLTYTTQTDYQSNASASGGGGGGSTSVYYNGGVQAIANGGNGGNGRQSKYNIWGYGGKGGNGGTTSGTGASGGSGAAGFTNNQLVGGTGSAGYVYIYKSNTNPN